MHQENKLPRWLVTGDTFAKIELSGARYIDRATTRVSQCLEFRKLIT